jgi:hypothetical protein
MRIAGCLQVLSKKLFSKIKLIVTATSTFLINWFLKAIIPAGNHPSFTIII